MNTKQIIQGCKDKDREAQKAFFMSFSNYLFGLINRYLADEFSAKDVLQDVFVILFKSMDKFQFEGEGQLKSWMKKIAVREAIRAVKKDRFQFEDLELTSAEIVDTKAITVMEKLNQEALLTLLHKLPIGYRTIFNLYAIEGYSHEEIASVLKISASTSRSQLTRARVLLKEFTLKFMKDE